MPDKHVDMYIGTSGWNYKAWKNDLYDGVRQKDWLQHYATHFNAVEINATFYRLQKETTLQGWMERTPADFVFAAKGSRYITHLKKLKNVRDSIVLQRDNLAPLGERLGAVLWQTPASLAKDVELLHEFVQNLQNWPGVKHVLELRHSSWFVPEVQHILDEHGVTPCVSDAADWPMWSAAGSDLVYIRLHGNQQTYQSWYSEAELQAWAEWIQGHVAQNRQAHIYFDNTDGLAAPQNAQRLQALLGTT